MAKVVPEGWRELSATGAAQRELETLGILADGLSDDYTIYHGLHWTRVDKGYALVGEIDFAIVSPAGKMLLIDLEQGRIVEDEELARQAHASYVQRIPGFAVAGSAATARDAVRLMAAGTPVDPTVHALPTPSLSVAQLGKFRTQNVAFQQQMNVVAKLPEGSVLARID